MSGSHECGESGQIWDISESIPDRICWRLDGKYERVVDYSQIVGLGHKANDGSIFWNWKQFQIEEVEVRKEEVWSNLKILCI